MSQTTASGFNSVTARTSRYRGCVTIYLHYSRPDRRPPSFKLRSRAGAGEGWVCSLYRFHGIYRPLDAICPSHIDVANDGVGLQLGYSIDEGKPISQRADDI